MKSFSLFLFFALVSQASAVTLYTESSDGSNDLSNDYLNPNTFVLELGENLLTAQVNSTETSPGVFAANQDFFTLIVPSNLQVTGMFLLGYDFGGASGNKTFLGYQDGVILQQAPETFTQATAGLIADLLFGTAEVVNDQFGYPFDPSETNLLDNFGSGTFATPAPLTPGSYAFWLREIEPEVARFTIDFRTEEFTPVPEPSTLGLLTLCLTSLVLRRRAG